MQIIGCFRRRRMAKQRHPREIAGILARRVALRPHRLQAVGALDIAVGLVGDVGERSGRSAPVASVPSTWASAPVNMVNSCPVGAIAS